MSRRDGAVRTHYRVLYGDVDSMGVVYYGNYLRLFERGRAEFIRARGLSYKQIEERELLLPVTETYCHYYLPARYDDLLLIETRLGKLRRASVRFEYDIYRDEGRDERLASGYTLHACLTPEGKVVRLPKFVLEILSGPGE